MTRLLCRLLVARRTKQAIIAESPVWREGDHGSGRHIDQASSRWGDVWDRVAWLNLLVRFGRLLALEWQLGGRSLLG